MDKEALKTDSNLSSMRIMFARVVNVSLFLAGIALGSYILGEFIFNKKLCTQCIVPRRCAGAGIAVGAVVGGGAYC